jgi:hypothetical protein
MQDAPVKHWSISTRLYGAISQKAVYFHVKIGFEIMAYTWTLTFIGCELGIYTTISQGSQPVFNSGQQYSGSLSISHLGHT